MTRKVLILGLILLAATLPLAAVPIAIFIVEAPLVIAAGVVPFVETNAQHVAVIALPFFRAPPSR